MTTLTSDYDAPWKGALETYLEDFFALLLPTVHGELGLHNLLAELAVPAATSD